MRSKEFFIMLHETGLDKILIPVTVVIVLIVLVVPMSYTREIEITFCIAFTAGLIKLNKSKISEIVIRTRNRPMPVADYFESILHRLDAFDRKYVTPVFYSILLFFAVLNMIMLIILAILKPEILGKTWFK